MDNTLKIKGTVEKIQEPQTFSSGFRKQTVIISCNTGEYPQEYPVEFLKDRISLVDDLSEDMLVEVTCALKGREWVGHDKWFLSLNCFEVKQLEASEQDIHEELDDDADDFPF